jgi:hypothetical protein
MVGRNCGEVGEEWWGGIGEWWGGMVGRNGGEEWWGGMVGRKGWNG